MNLTRDIAEHRPSRQPRHGLRAALRRGVRARWPSLATVVLAVLGFATAAQAQRIENRTAVFAALDKVTARISPIEAPLGQTETFGALRVTARACYSRPPTEPPRTSTFVEVDEVLLDGSTRRVFAGWMFAESPGLNAVEHPVFDLWLTACKEPVQRGQAARPRGPAGSTDAEPAPATEPEAPRRRVRR